MNKFWEYNKPIFIRKLIDRVENLNAGQCLSFITNSEKAFTTLRDSKEEQKRTKEDHASMLEYARECTQHSTESLQPLHDAILHELLHDYHWHGLRQHQTQNVLELIVHDTTLDITMWKLYLWDLDYEKQFDALDLRASEL